MSRIAEKAILVLNDIIAVNLAFFVAYSLRFHSGLIEPELTLSNQAIFLIASTLTVIWVAIFIFFGIYRSKFYVSRTDELLNIFKSVVLGLGLLFIQSFDLNNPLPRSRMILFAYGGFLFFFLGVGRISIRSYQRNRLKRGHGHRKTVIVGTGKRAKEVYDVIRDRPVMGFQVEGFLNYESAKSGYVPEDKILGGIEEFDTVCKDFNVEEALIILERPSRKKLFQIVDTCNGSPVMLRTIPDIYQIALGNPRIHNIFGLELVDILPEGLNPGLKVVKRTLDIILSILVIFVLLPLWVVIGFMIKFDSRGPIFFKQKRVGFNGSHFNMYKFRSMMYETKEYDGSTLTQTDDPRITKFGRFLRDFRIDEIPQFINVLEGDMSIVGPRPELPYYVRKYSKQIPLYTKRLKIKPGITGLAQVKQKFHESVTDIGKKLEFDLYYLENISLQLDLKIMVATVYTVLGKRGG